MAGCWMAPPIPTKEVIASRGGQNDPPDIGIAAIASAVIAEPTTIRTTLFPVSVTLPPTGTWRSAIRKVFAERTMPTSKGG